MKNLKFIRIARILCHYVGNVYKNTKVFYRRGSTYASVIILLTYTESVAQTKYFQPTGIIDKTEDLRENKAEWTLLGDKEKIDGYTRVGDSVFGGEIACNISPIKDADALTFTVYPGTKYAKDKKRVYYPVRIKCVDYEDCGVCYYENVIVEKATPSTFRYLGKDYSTDGKHAYFRGQLIKGADGSTFKVIKGPEYFYFAADKNCVYMYEKAFKGTDPSTFHYMENDSRNNLSESNSIYIIGDKNNEWEYTPPDALKRL